MNRELLEQLVHLSAELQKAHAKARELGRDDICQYLRQAGWKVAASMSDLARDRSGAEVEAS